MIICKECGFGVTAICKTKTKEKSLAGIILGAAILISVIGHLFL